MGSAKSRSLSFLNRWKKAFMEDFCAASAALVFDTLRAVSGEEEGAGFGGEGRCCCCCCWREGGEEENVCFPAIFTEYRNKIKYNAKYLYFLTAHPNTLIPPPHLLHSRPMLLSRVLFVFPLLPRQL